MLLVGAQCGHEGEGDSGERVVDDQRGGDGGVEARGEEPAHGVAVGAGLHAQKAMAADRIAAECELGVAGIRVADSAGVECDDELTRTQPRDSSQE